MDALSYAEYWRLLLEVEREGSLSAAAESLGLELASASRMLRALEKAAGFPLLDRARKPARLSARARSLVPYAREIVRARDALGSALGAGEEAEPRAALPRHVRISIPTNASRGVFYSLLKRFEESRPGLRLEICADTGAQGLLDGVADIAILGYTPTDAGLHVIPARASVTLLLASVDYVKRFGAPKEIGELASRTLILRSSSSRAFSTRLEKGGEAWYVPPGQSCRQGDAPYCRDQLMRGRGIALDVALGLVEKELASGEVVPVLPGWHREPWRNSVACREDVFRDPVCRELAELLRGASDEVETGLWQHWYRHFGIPLEEAGLG